MSLRLARSKLLAFWVLAIPAACSSGSDGDPVEPQPKTDAGSASCAGGTPRTTRAGDAVAGALGAGEGPAGAGGTSVASGSSGTGAPASDAASVNPGTASPDAAPDLRPPTDLGRADAATPGAVPPPPPGKVPMFVAGGHGGRTITSCDDGRTWIANHAFEDRNVDHSPYTEKGLVYGNGVFLLLMGWGAPGSVKLSRNGVDWKRVDVPRGGDGGIAFLDRPAPLFVALGGYGGCQSSPDGERWTRCAAPSFPENLREAGGGGPALGVGGDIAAMFSFDGGKSWRTGGPCTLIDGFGNLGQEGGFAWGKGTFAAAASNGSWCATSDLGATWKTGRLEGPAGGKMAFLGDRFVAPNGRDGHLSDDGVTWRREAWKPAGTNIHAIARSDAGTYVGVERASASSRFFRSTDGVTWTAVMGPTGTSLRRVVFGYGEPSAVCPSR